jgi:hypothetical protein
MHDASEIISATDFWVSQTLCLGGASRTGVLWHVVILRLVFFVPLGIRNNDESHSGHGMAFPFASGQHNRVIRVKASIGSTEEDCLLDDRSKRIHTVIHM